MKDRILIGSDIGTYTPAAGAKTITLAGLNFTPTIEQISYIYNVTQDKFYYAPAVGLAKATLSGLVITIDDEFDVLAATDEIHIQMWIPAGSMGFDFDNNALNVSNISPDYAHNAYGAVLISVDDLAEGDGGDGAGGAGDNFYYLVPAETYNRFVFNFLSTTGAGNTFTIDIFATENPDAVSSPDASVDLTGDAWKNIASFHAGVSQISVGAGVTEQVDRWELDVCAKYLLVQVLVVDGGSEDNSLDCWVSKMYV